MKDRIAKIAENVFLASIRNASLEPNYDNIQVDKDKGIFIELDGTLDYDSIDNTFDNEKNNLKEIAKDISDQLVKDNKDYMKQTFEMDVDSIDVSKYKIIHDDKKNQLFLFLPASAVNTKKEEEENSAKQKEDDGRNIDIVNEIVKALNHFIKNSKPQSKTSAGDTSITIFTKSNKGSSFYEGYDIEARIERVSGKRNDLIESNLYLKIIYDNQTVYDKYVKNSIKFNQFDLIADRQDDNGIVFTQGNNGVEFIKNAEKLIKEIEKKDEGSVKAFEKDLNSDKVKAKIQEEYDNQAEFES